VSVRKTRNSEAFTEDQMGFVWHKVFVDASTPTIRNTVRRLKGAASGYLDAGVLFHIGSRLNADTLDWVANDFGDLVTSQRLGALLGDYPIASSITAQAKSKHQHLYVLVVSTKETKKHRTSRPFYFTIYGDTDDVRIVANELRSKIDEFSKISNLNY